MGSSRRWWLNQDTHSNVANSTAGEEYRAAAHTVRPVQPVDGAANFDGSAGLSAPDNGRMARKPAKTAWRSCRSAGFIGANVHAEQLARQLRRPAISPGTWHRKS